MQNASFIGIEIIMKSKQKTRAQTCRVPVLQALSALFFPAVIILALNLTFETSASRILVRLRIGGGLG